jgi:hypothetical protein
VPSHAVTNAGTFAVQAAQSGTWNVTNISGTVSLPTGAATAANQATANTSLSSIDGKLPALGQALAAGSIPVVLTANQLSTLTPLSSITVSNFPSTQAVSGTITANAGTGTFAVSAASLPLPSGAATAAKQPALGTAGTASTDVITVQGIASMTALKVDGSAVTQPVSGTFWQATQPVSISSAVPITDNSGSITVDNGGTFSTQDSQVIADNGGFTDGTSKVFCAGFIYDEVAGTALTENDAAAARINVNRSQIHVFEDGVTRGRYATVTAANAVKVDGSGVTQPVSGTFWQATQPVSLASVPSHAVTNAGTFAVQDSQGVTDNAAFTDGTTKLFCSGYIYDEVAGTALTENDAAAARINVNRAQIHILEDGTTRGRYATITASNALKVDGSAVTQPVSGTFWQTTQPVSIATAVPVTDNSGSLTVDNAGTFAVQASGDVAHGSSDSGNPVKVGAKTRTSPKGVTLTTDGQRIDAIADADGIPIVKLGTSGADCISESVSNTDGNSTAFTNFSAVLSTKNAITAYSIFRTDAGTSMAYVDFRDGTAGSVIWRVPLPPNGGANLSLGGQPIFKTSANTALAYDVSSALTTVYICVSGFQTKV